MPQLLSSSPATPKSLTPLKDSEVKPRSVPCCIGKPQTDPAARVDRFLEYVTKQPQSLDPAGVVEDKAPIVAATMTNKSPQMIYAETKLSPANTVDVATPKNSKPQR